MPHSRAEDSGKSATHQLKILEKDRYGSIAKTANPQLVIIFSDGGMTDCAPVQQKVRPGCGGFQK